MKKHNLLAAILFCGFLLVFSLGYFLPRSDFSEMEKRYLAEAPDFRWKTVVSGQWSAQAEDYLSDHVAGRNFLVGVNAYLERLAGRQHLKDVWQEAGKLLEAPVEKDDKAIARNLTALENLGKTLNQDIHLLVVPSAGWAAGVAGYDDDETIAAIAAAAGSRVKPIDVTKVYRGKPELYYSTDHHWTSRGAYLGYAAAMEAMGREIAPETAFTVTTVENFRGSTYSRSALWLTAGETLELWQGSGNLTVTNGETEGVHPGIFYPERLAEADKYTVFLDGNHSVVRIQNPEKTGRLLVLRDSYGNCLGGFLGESYGETVLIDLRYYRSAVSTLAKEEPFDQILVCYSSANFLTDTNLTLLR